MSDLGYALDVSNNAAVGTCSNTAFKITTLLTVAVWVYPIGIAPATWYICTSTDTVTQGYELHRTTSNAWVFRLALLGGQTVVIAYSGANRPALNAWSRVVFTVRRETSGADFIYHTNVYINNINVSAVNTTRQQPINYGTGTTFSVGNNAIAGVSFHGYLDQLDVLNVEKDATWVAADYNSGAGRYAPDDTDLIGGWRFDENTGTTAADYSGNSHTLSLSNCGWTQGLVPLNPPVVGGVVPTRTLMGVGL